MRKILSVLLILSTVFSLVSPVLAITTRSALPKNSPSFELVYPEGADFVKLKDLIETNFSKSDGSYGYRCIAKHTLCPNYKYTNIIEKAIKLIMLKTYIGNEEFYNSLLNDSSRMNYASQNGSDIKYLLDRIPHGSLVLDSRSLGFGQSIGGELLEASFGVNFSESNNTSSMLGAIEQKIKDLKRTKCQKESRSNDCYTGTLPNSYLPTQEELYKESIYLNRSSVRIGNLSDEIEYTVIFFSPIEQLLNSSTTNYESGELSNTSTGRYVGYMGSMMFMKTEGITQKDALENCMRNVGANSGKGVRCMWNDKQIYPLVVREIGTSSESIPVPQSYMLRYKKDTYTLEEAKAVIEKKEVPTGNFVVTSNGTIGGLPCENTMSSQCNLAKAGLRNVQVALAAYFTNNNAYPDTLDKIKGTYSNPFPQDFENNFSYRLTKNINGESDYEIKYIGHIGEGTAEAITKKDYRAMMSGAVVPEIPAIFAHIPADSMALYIKNPANLIDILNQKSSTSQRLSGIDVSESIRTFMKTFFELEKFDQIEKNLKHEMAIVVNNMDATAPDIVIILSESDKAALSPTAQARVVGSRDGYIFIASSKESLERFTGLIIENSLKNASDFQYVWWKKSALIKDAMMFVGDAFFEKMLTFETYLTHYRKYRDYARLSSLQELVWAYTDAFGKSPTRFDEFITAGFSTLTGEVLGEYSISNGLVTHRNIGTLKSVKTLPEARYDLSKVSKTEIEDYKYNVLKYREIWRASLDPMGIVINRYGDGMEIDFFMTPIPSSTDRELQEIQKMFEGATKDTLSFVTNSHIRMGLLSFVVGFDPKKLETKIKANEEIGGGFESFSKEVLDGKNIFDYLGGEFAWSLGGLDPDIFEGWNVDKVDAYVSIQVASEAKGKELIDAFKSKMLDITTKKTSSSESAIINMLAKPLIEDYKGKKIYYVEAIPIPWVGKIGIAYTFVDDFFIIGINRPTIRHVIDTAVSGDIRKKNLVNADSLSQGTFFAALFDGESSSQQIKKLYEKNQSVLPRYIERMINTKSSVTPLISSYYASQDRNMRLGKKGEEFNYTIGSISFSGIGDKIVAKIDQSKLSSLSGASFEAWEAIKNENTLPQAIFTEKGVPLDELLSLKNVADILSLNLQVQLNNAIGGPESLFRNVIFGMNMGDDEIGFRLQIFREKEGGKTFALSGSSDIWIILGLIIFLGIIGIVMVFITRHKNAIIPAQQVDNSTKDAIIEESPVIVSTLIVPQQTNVITPASVETIPQTVSMTSASESTLISPINLVKPVPVVVEPVPVVVEPVPVVVEPVPVVVEPVPVVVEPVPVDTPLPESSGLSSENVTDIK